MLAFKTSDRNSLLGRLIDLCSTSTLRDKLVKIQAQVKQLSGAVEDEDVRFLETITDIGFQVREKKKSVVQFIKFGSSCSSMLPMRWQQHFGYGTKSSVFMLFNALSVFCSLP